MVIVESAIRDGLVLEYTVRGSTGPGTSRVVTERFSFHAQPDSRFEVRLEGEEVATELYAAVYGVPMLVDSGLVASNGMPFQFREQATGLLVGIEYGADLPEARFIYCDAELQSPLPAVDTPSA